MQIIISLNSVDDQLRGEKVAALRVDRPKGLIPVAGVPVLAHILNQLRPLLTAEAELILVGAAHVDAAVAWVSGAYPQVKVMEVAADEAVSPLWACREMLGDEPVLWVASDSFVVAEFEALQGDLEVDAAVLVSDKDASGRYGGMLINDEELVQQTVMGGEEGVAAVGTIWLRNGAALVPFVKAEQTQLELIQMLLTNRKAVLAGTVTHWVEINSLADFLNANKRLLGTGYGTDEALERSYIEEFAVIPPVYLHPGAEVIASVIGPYASIGAGAVVKSAVVRDCIIEAGATVENCILETSFIGRDGQVSGSVLRDKIVVGG